MTRLRRFEKLVAGRPDDPLAHLVLAEASLDAKLWGQARAHLLAALDVRPSARAYSLLARLEEEEYGDRETARRWREQAAGAPADPVWLCRACGKEAAGWSLACPHCRAIDRLELAAPKVPAAGLAAS
jgi:HemY protein